MTEASPKRLIEQAREALKDYTRSQPSDYERAYAQPLADALRSLLETLR